MRSVWRLAPCRKPAKDGQSVRMKEDSEFKWPIRVYWEDTDAGGVVYHARYLAFLERARTEWMRSIGYGQLELCTTHHIVFAVCAMDTTFKLPARLDDLLHVTVAMQACKRASLVLKQTIYRQAETVFHARVRIAALSAGAFRPCAIPANVYATIKKKVHNDSAND